jgi:hypothetical protein
VSAKASCLCGRKWTGLSEAHCTVCHEHFSGVSAFDAHRPGNIKGCVDPATLRRGKVSLLEERKGPFGITWAYNQALRGDSFDPSKRGR